MIISELKYKFTEGKIMILLFTLSMPNVGSWNGKWTGRDSLYAITETFRGEKEEEKVQKIVDKGYYYYNFGDGWGAGVTVEVVNSSEAAKARKKSKGFYGYNWMVHSIIKHGEIYNLIQEKELIKNEN